MNICEVILKAVKKDKRISLGDLIAKKDRNESININLNYK